MPGLFSFCFLGCSKVPAFLNVVDIAGLVKGAHAGQGLGNAFLSHISACDGIFHMTRESQVDEQMKNKSLLTTTRAALSYMFYTAAKKCVAATFGHILNSSSTIFFESKGFSCAIALLVEHLVWWGPKINKTVRMKEVRPNLKLLQEAPEIKGSVPGSGFTQSVAYSEVWKHYKGSNR